ncbi:hypothetical protein F7734_49060 [Scytonema sp. UIC 10036]|uniref:hypothetical protein n=1 Tax=Scytonema sp. UIC 10036 TaxID=2304196 RepID=UPI0012DA8495|nr:hypothetical protein [Scytonema sp. UIC 10036]MUG99805.1 hypothetical protein [Scytonema sp. UIC 10036]
MGDSLNANEAQSLAKKSLYLAADEAARIVKNAMNYNSPEGNAYASDSGGFSTSGEAKKIQLALEVLRIAWLSK